MKKETAELIGGAMALVIIVAVLVFSFAIAWNINDAIKEKGLKGIVEEIWNGKG